MDDGSDYVYLYDDKEFVDTDRPGFRRRIVNGDGEATLHVIYIDYLATVAGGELKAGSDVGEAIWVRREEIRQIWEELHDDTRRLLKIANVV